MKLGERTCSEDGKATVLPPLDGPVGVPWSTGFENELCDYTELNGYCYAPAGAKVASWDLVTTPPAHTGRYSAAFTIRTDAAQKDNQTDNQTRCVRIGALPQKAYYGAWYYIPSVPTQLDRWNLIHFDGGSDLKKLEGNLDVTLIEANGGLQLAVFGKGYARIAATAKAPNIPIGSWFRVQLYLERAGSAGKVSLYQDGQLIFAEANVATDDSAFGSWYVGNLAYSLTPADSTVYVDDVTLRNDLQ